MQQPRTYLTRSTRDGLGIVPDGTHPVLEDGQPDFEAFKYLGQVLDYVRNDAAPAWADLVRSVRQLKLGEAIMVLRSLTQRARTEESAEMWMAVYSLTTTLGTEARRIQDPISMSQVNMIASALDADGMPILTSAGYLMEELEEPEAPADMTEAETFADIVAHYGEA